MTGRLKSVLNLVAKGISFDTLAKLDDSVDYRQSVSIAGELAKIAEINRRVEQLDFAEACAMGCGAVQSKKGSQSYNKWRASMIRGIRKLEGEKILTVWDRIPKKSTKR